MSAPGSSQLALFDEGGTGFAASGGAMGVDGAAPVSIRRSRRARRLTLRFMPPHTLELVVPWRAHAADVKAFLHEQREWIVDAGRKLAKARSLCELPHRLTLDAVDEQWSVTYRRGARAGARTSSVLRELVISGPDTEHARAPELLRRWLRTKARDQLTPWLYRVAADAGLEPTSVQVRLQRTRWGSCSSDGRISLNAGLMFVAPELVRYLMIHELCHLRHMNHSQRFWRLVARMEPDYRLLDRRLAEAWSMIPWWLYTSAAR